MKGKPGEIIRKLQNEGKCRVVDCGLGITDDRVDEFKAADQK